MLCDKKITKRFLQVPIGRPFLAPKDLCVLACVLMFWSKVNVDQLVPNCVYFTLQLHAIALPFCDFVTKQPMELVISLE